MSAQPGEKPAHVVKIIESQMPADRQASAVEVRATNAARNAGSPRVMVEMETLAFQLDSWASAFSLPLNFSNLHSSSHDTSLFLSLETRFASPWSRTRL